MEKFEKKDFLGADMDDEIAQGVAMGDRDPITKEKFKDDENEKYLVQKALGKKPSYNSSYYNK